MVERFTTAPIEVYGDPDVYARERERIFARSWQFLGLKADLPRAGDYLADVLAGYPVVVVRDEKGKLRGYHNVCRHRAGPLAEDGEGRCEGQLVCRYHGWRYALDGRLANARDFGPAEGFDPRAFALYGIACETWRGFVFVNLDATAAPLAETLAPLDARVRRAGVALETFRFWRRETHEIRCNWKTYVENYLEGYHVPLVHPGLNANVDAAKYTVDVEAPAIFHWAPPRNGAPMSGLWAWQWPCLGVNVYQDGLMMERMWPLDHERTVLDYLYCFPEGLSPADKDRPVASSTVITEEDARITEAVQRNLNAGVYSTGRLSPRHETGIAWFQAEVLRALRQP